MIKDQKKTIKRYHNQYLKDMNYQKEELMKVIYDLFNGPVLLVAPEEEYSSKQKDIFKDYRDKSKKEKVWLPDELVNSKKKYLMEQVDDPHKID